MARHDIRHQETGRYIPIEAKELQDVEKSDESVQALGTNHHQHAEGPAEFGPDHIVHDRRDKSPEVHMNWGYKY